MSKKIRLGKRKLKDKVLNDLESQFEVYKKCGNITIFSNKQINIDGCYGITEISDEQINLNLGEIGVLIKGNSFDIKDYTDKSMIICGNLQSLEFSK